MPTTSMSAVHATRGRLEVAMGVSPLLRVYAPIVKPPTNANLYRLSPDVGNAEVPMARKAAPGHVEPEDEPQGLGSEEREPGRDGGMTVAQAGDDEPGAVMGYIKCRYETEMTRSITARASRRRRAELGG
jgi:hypothetical protein